MTLRERAIISAYTGVLMCDFKYVHEYIEEILERPVWTHELALDLIQNEIKEKSRGDFLKLCGNEDDKQPYCKKCRLHELEEQLNENMQHWRALKRCAEADSQIAKKEEYKAAMHHLDKCILNEEAEIKELEKEIYGDLQDKDLGELPIDATPEQIEQYVDRKRKNR